MFTNIHLNLADSTNSIIKYKVNNYPDGQQDIVIQGAYSLQGDVVWIGSRFNSFKDLELIICATNALRRLGHRNISLYIPYLLGARSDRKFELGGVSYLVDVIAPILNAQHYEDIRVLDVHNGYVADACIRGLIQDDNSHLLWHSFCHSTLGSNSGQPALVLPDKGVQTRLKEQLGKYRNCTIICGDKVRGDSGEVDKVTFDVPEGTKSALIVDDICDGGGTFIAAAKVLKSKGVENLYLCVTHGIFSKGLQDLFKYYKKIYTTNSVRNKEGIYGYSYYANDIVVTRVI